jgi:hypothetical protein
MLALKELSRHLQKDGSNLNEDDLNLIAQTLLSFAKVEYEVYRQQKSVVVHCNSHNPHEIGNIQKLAS